MTDERRPLLSNSQLTQWKYDTSDLGTNIQDEESVRVEMKNIDVDKKKGWNIIN